MVRELAEIPERPKDYPDPTMFGLLPTYGLYVRHASGLTMRGIELRGVSAEKRAAIVMDDVSACRIENLQARELWLNDVRRSAIYDPVGQARVRVSGSKSAELKLSPEIEVAIDTDVPAKAIIR